MSLITLRLCVKRDNLGVPKELWNIICEHIENYLNSLIPARAFTYYCNVDHRIVNISAKYLPKKCECHNQWIDHRFSHTYKPRVQYELSCEDLNKFVR